MTQTHYTRFPGEFATLEQPGTTVLAAGLFGYCIDHGRMSSLKATEGYLRDIEQMPNFAPPSVSNFVAQYLASNIGKTRSSS